MNKHTLAFLFFMLLTGSGVYAQDKGVDTQTNRIRDTGTNRAPATNGTNQNIGSGRGIDFGKGRTPEVVPLANPYRFTARRDAVISAVRELMLERKLVLDTSVSKPDEGVLITQPYRFVKGAVVAQTELNRYAEIPNDRPIGWSQGRYTLLLEVQALNATTTTVAVNARVEGRSDGAVGAEWLSLPSSGGAEQEFLTALIEKITGAAPEGRGESVPQN
ncbi:MAG: hypothetical protein ACRD9R_10520 [Pyrinomonadaceae bacterium]